MKNKITFILLHLGYGGIETSTINTVNALADLYNVELVSIYHLMDNQEDLINNKVKIIHLYEGEPNRNEFITACKNKNILHILREGLRATIILINKKTKLIKFIKNCDSKVIVSTRYEISQYLSKFKRKNVVAIAQEHRYHNNDKKYINVLKHKYKNINYIFALTDSLKKFYEEILSNNKKQNILTIPNMVETSNFESKLNSNNVISVGRLHQDKRVNELINIVSKTKNVNKFYVIGDGIELDNIKQLVNKMKLSSKIIILGYKNKTEIEKYLLNSSLFLMASITEGLPMVLLESMSFGVPCIAYDIECGVKDIIDNNENGIIIKNRNEKEFVDTIDKLLLDKECLKKLGSNAKKKSLLFSKEKIVEKWKNVLDEYLERK